MKVDPEFEKCTGHPVRRSHPADRHTGNTPQVEPRRRRLSAASFLLLCEHMGRTLAFFVALPITVGLAVVTSDAQAPITHPLARALPHRGQPKKPKDPEKLFAETVRLAAIRKAQVWTRT